MLDEQKEKQEADERDKEVVFKNRAPFTDCISKINNTQKDNAKDLNVVTPVYSFIEYSDNFQKISGSYGGNITEMKLMILL